MSETNAKTSTEQTPDPIQAEAKRLMDEIKTIKSRVEECLKATELARQKADSEALFAFNAKGACEGHSTAIANLKGTVEADIKSITTNKQKTDELLAFITAGKPVIDSEMKAITERRKEVDQASQEIVKVAQTGSVRLQEIDASKTAAETALKTTNEALKAAVLARTNAEAAEEESTKFSADSRMQTATVAENLKVTKQCSVDVQKLLTDAQNDKTELATVLEHIAKSDEITVGYEARLVKLTEELGTLIKKADDLLPNFASAGLASAFCAQKKRFAWPQIWWLATFILCVVLLIIVALPSFLAAVFPSYLATLTGKTVDPTWNETLHGMVMRLPILIPLVWLAIYAGRNHMLSVRLEEDYAYKEAISIAFEGYKREMQGIAAGNSTDSAPINKLCVNILTAIAERPGRIYDHHNKDITVANEVTEIMAKANEFRQKQTATR
jgi:hypothetical protein